MTLDGCVLSQSEIRLLKGVYLFPRHLIKRYLLIKVGRGKEVAPVQVDLI